MNIFNMFRKKEQKVESKPRIPSPLYKTIWVEEEFDVEKTQIEIVFTDGTSTFKTIFGYCQQYRDNSVHISSSYDNALNVASAILDHNTYKYVDNEYHPTVLENKTITRVVVGETTSHIEKRAIRKVVLDSVDES